MPGIVPVQGHGGCVHGSTWAWVGTRNQFCFSTGEGGRESFCLGKRHANGNLLLALKHRLAREVRWWTIAAITSPPAWPRAKRWIVAPPPGYQRPCIRLRWLPHATT